MIYTVTLNPAIDYVLKMQEVRLGATNRSQKEEIYFGGKGINVSLVLQQLGLASKALGFIAGFTGEAIEKGLAGMGIATDFVRLEKGNSRINIKLRAEEETELNAQGPDITESEMEELLQKLDTLQDGDTLILAGSIPSSLPSDCYERILERVAAKKIRVVVDATGELLWRVLKYKPFLIKPNHYELGELFGKELKTEEELEAYARRLQESGAENVLVSRAGEGAVLVDATGCVHWCGACRGTVKNSVGAGDSMVAGFLAGIREEDYAYALKLGTAAGGATAFSEGLATREKILELLQTL